MDVTDEKDIIPAMSETINAKIFQVGVYQTLEEAEKEASLKKGIVISEEENYNVYISILKNSSNIEKMMNYLDENSIDYYLKDITLDTEFLDTLNKYENLMKNTTSTVAFIQLNKRILERYQVLYES